MSDKPQSNSCLDHFDHVLCDEGTLHPCIPGYTCTSYRLALKKVMPEEISVYKSEDNGDTFTFLWFDGRLYVLELYKDTSMPDIGVDVDTWESTLEFISTSHKAVYQMMVTGHEDIPDVINAIEYMNKHQLGDDHMYFPHFLPNIHFTQDDPECVTAHINGGVSTVDIRVGGNEITWNDKSITGLLVRWLSQLFHDVNITLGMIACGGNKSDSRWHSLSLIESNDMTMIRLVENETGDIYMHACKYEIVVKNQDSLKIKTCVLMADAIKLVLGMITLSKNDPDGEDVEGHDLIFKCNEDDPTRGEFWYRQCWDDDSYEGKPARLVYVVDTHGAVNYDWKKDLPKLRMYRDEGFTSCWN